MKIISISLLISLLTSLFGYEYEVKKGWQQLGAITNIYDLSVFDNTCVDYIIYYNNEEGNTLKKLYKTNSLDFKDSLMDLKTLERGVGFTVLAKEDCNILVPDADLGELIFKNKIYKSIKSPITGKNWLDRNIGAKKSCEESNNNECYGDYFQWGRLIDGHEKKDSLVINEQANTIPLKNPKSILSSNINNFDWANTIDDTGELRKNVWADATSKNICPKGFRVPTIEELKAETINTNIQLIDSENNGNIRVTNSLTAMQNFLKIPLAGGRDSRDLENGNMFNVDSVGYLWTNSFSNTKPHAISINSYQAYERNSQMTAVYAFPIRCIKE